MLINSASTSRELAATMVMVVKGFKEISPSDYEYLETDKALLTGLLADIGFFCIVSEYHAYLEKGNYLDEDIAFQVFNNLCTSASELVLKQWGFDHDFIDVASNHATQVKNVNVSYLDVARIANHILMFRRQDDQIDEHTVEFDVTGADILYKLSNLSDIEFKSKINELISASGL